MREERLVIRILDLMLIVFMLLGTIHVPNVRAAGEVWTFVDGNLSTGLNKDTARNAVDPVMAVYNNELYLAWTENNSTTTQIRIRKYNGSSWSWADGGSSTGINYNTAESANSPYLYVFNSNLYAIWNELYSGASVTRVKRYDGGGTWTSIDGSATNGLNKQSVTSSGPTLGMCDGNLYASWVESYGGSMQLRVKRYDGGSSWTFVDGGGYTGLNADTGKNANKPRLLDFNNVLYLIWTETNASAKNQIRVKSFDGDSIWTAVDGGSGLNYNAANNVVQAGLAVNNDMLYAFWLENYRIRVKSYNGSTWSTADANTGFIQNNMNYIYNEAPPKAISYNNKLYFTWGEDISYDPWSIQTRAAYYQNASMTFIDGNDWTTGLNYNRLRYAYSPAIAEYNGSLYVAWYESNGSANQVRLRSTPLPAMVTSVTVPAFATYIPPQNLDFSVTFSKTVTVSGSPVIPITLSSGVVYASYYSGTNSSTVTFRYTVATGNLDTDGISLGTNITLNGGTIRDVVSSLDAAANLKNVPNTAGILVDGVPPAAPLVLTPASDSITSDNTPVTSGSAEPGSTVTVLIDGVADGTATTDTNGNWSYTRSAALADGAHTVSARATDVAGNTGIDSTTNTFTVVTVSALAIIINGSGSVNSHNQSGTNYACTKIAGGLCDSMIFGYNDTVTLIPAGSNSTFNAWGGDYSGDGHDNPGSILMNANKSVTATFTPDPAKVLIDGSSSLYYSIGAALDACTQDGTVRALASPLFVENILMAITRTLKLRGGFTDAGFTDGSQTGYSTISGSLKVRAGKLTVERVKVKNP